MRARGAMIHEGMILFLNMQKHESIWYATLLFHHPINFKKPMLVMSMTPTKSVIKGEKADDQEK